jgi:hypothetical protein
MVNIGKILRIFSTAQNLTRISSFGKSFAESTFRAEQYFRQSLDRMIDGCLDENLTDYRLIEESMNSVLYIK